MNKNDLLEMLNLLSSQNCDNISFEPSDDFETSGIINVAVKPEIPCDNVDVALSIE